MYFHICKLPVFCLLTLVFKISLFCNQLLRMNPVTGCWEPPRTNPMEGMSEEQKEYEAVQLANLMAKLSK